MAIAKFTRLQRTRARSATSRSRPVRRSQPRGGVSTLAPSAAVDSESFRHLSLVPRLRAIYGTAITAELALRNRGAEQDPEVADCLRAGVCDPIADQIRALEEFTGHPPETTRSK